MDPNQLLTLYETRTIHHTATVYLPDENREGPEHSSHSDTDSSPGPYIPGCTSCINPTPTLPEVDQDIGVLIGDDPGPRLAELNTMKDKILYVLISNCGKCTFVKLYAKLCNRYWLLTVLRGGNGVPPKVELRLARLYRKAFRRQQERHLGLLGDRTRRASKNQALLENLPLNVTNTTKHVRVLLFDYFYVNNIFSTHLYNNF